MLHEKWNSEYVRKILTLLLTTDHKTYVLVRQLISFNIKHFTGKNVYFLDEEKVNSNCPNSQKYMESILK